MQVDESGSNRAARHVHHARAVRMPQAPPYRGDTSIFDQDVRHAIDAIGRIDDPTSS